MSSGLRPSQQKFIEAIKSGSFDYLMAAGTAGAGKSIATIGFLHFLCCNLHNVRFAVFRKTEKNLKQTTIPSYRKIKKLSKTSNASEVVDMTARYPETGSEIIFQWADISKDPDLDNIKGLELTGALFEEANQIDKGYFEICKTRIGRWNNKKVKKFILLNMNPAQGWCKDIFYDPWANAKLEAPYYFQEFTESDLVDVIENTDEMSSSYLQGLYDLPDAERDRYLKNVWNYLDIPNQLIKYEWYKRCILEEPIPKKGDSALMAVDPAWEGNDDTVLARMHGNHIGWFEAYPKQDPDITGVLAVERAREFNIRANDVVVDPIGVGAGTVCKMRNDLKFFPDLFLGGDSSVNVGGYLETFNKRSEAHWILRELLRNEEITISHSPQLQKELLAIKYAVDDKKIKILPKKDIKKDLGKSPGFADVAMMLAHKHKTEYPGQIGKILDSRKPQDSDINRFFGHSSNRAETERMQTIKKNRMAGIGYG